MIVLASGSAVSSESPVAFHARWVDHATWRSWSPDTEWVRLDGPVVPGATGRMKPEGGPVVRFVVTESRADDASAVYTDVTRFPGARLTFTHTAVAAPDGTRLEVEVRLDGPLARLWALPLRSGFEQSAQQDLDRLVALVRPAAGRLPR